MVKEAQQQLHISKENLASELGVIYITINRWENGRSKALALGKQKIEERLRTMGEQGSGFLKDIFGQNTP